MKLPIQALVVAILPFLVNSASVGGLHYKRGSVLEVILSPVDNAVVKATVKNVGNEDLNLLTYGTLFDKAPVQNLNVFTSNYTALPFQGVLKSVLHTGLSEDAFMLLPAGATFETIINAAEVYDFFVEDEDDEVEEEAFVLKPTGHPTSPKPTGHAIPKPTGHHVINKRKVTGHAVNPKPTGHVALKPTGHHVLIRRKATGHVALKQTGHHIMRRKATGHVALKPTGHHVINRRKVTGHAIAPKPTGHVALKPTGHHAINRRKAAKTTGHVTAPKPTGHVILKPTGHHVINRRKVTGHAIAPKPTGHVIPPSEGTPSPEFNLFKFVAEGAIPYAKVNSTELTGNAIYFKSNTLPMNVDIDAATQVAKAFTGAKNSAALTACSSSQTSASNKALANCASLALAASTAAKDGSVAKFAEFFKTTAASTRSIVAERFSAVAKECSSKAASGATTYHCQDVYGYCDANVLAYTIPFTSEVVNCPSYYSELPAMTGTCHAQDQALTTLLEMTHAPTVYEPATQNNAFGYAAATALSSGSAVLNADSYALFANAVYARC